MVVNERTRRVLAYRKAARDWTRDGFVPVLESGDPLWQFHRGAWINKHITDVRIAPGGHELWIKTD